MYTPSAAGEAIRARLGLAIDADRNIARPAGPPPLCLRIRDITLSLDIHDRVLRAAVENHFTLCDPSASNPLLELTVLEHLTPESDLMFRSPFRKVLVKGRGKVFFGVQDTTTLRVLAGSLGSDTPDAEASETDILQCLLEAEILAAVAHAAPELDFLHAATISRNGNGILLVGASGRGKSTLSEVAALRGFQVLGDDVACVDFAARTAYSYPRKPRLRSDTAALLRPFGWEDRAFVATGEQTPITAICVLEPRADAPALTPLQGMDAVWQMIAHLFPAGRPLAPIVARIAQQLPGLPCYRLSPAGLQETIAMLETMTQSKVASL